MRAGPAPGTAQAAAARPGGPARRAAAAARGVPGRAGADVPARPGRHRAAGQHPGQRAARFRARLCGRQALHRLRGPALPGRGAKPARGGRADRPDAADPVSAAPRGGTVGRRADRRAGPAAGGRRPARGGGQLAWRGSGPGRRNRSQRGRRPRRDARPGNGTGQPGPPHGGDDPPLRPGHVRDPAVPGERHLQRVGDPAALCPAAGRRARRVGDRGRGAASAAAPAVRHGAREPAL